MAHSFDTRRVSKSTAKGLPSLLRSDSVAGNKEAVPQIIVRGSHIRKRRFMSFDKYDFLSNWKQRRRDVVKIGWPKLPIILGVVRLLPISTISMIAGVIPH